MDILFAENQPIIDLHLSLDGKTLTYNQGETMMFREPRGSAKEAGTGRCLRSLGDGRMVFIRDGALFITEDGNSAQAVQAKGDYVKKLDKVIINRLAVNASGNMVVCGMGGIKRPDVWGNREYCGLVDLTEKTFSVFDKETYGGEAVFHPSENIFALFALEIKNGALYLMDADGNMLGQFVGKDPAFSPNGQMIAYRKEGAILFAAQEGDGWKETELIGAPEDDLSLSNTNPPVWIDDTHLVYDANRTLYYYNINKNGAKKLAELPDFVVRRANTLAGPYHGGVLAVVRDGDREAVALITPE